MYYRLTGDSENYANLLPINYSQELAEKFNGTSLINGWQKLYFKLVDPTDLRPLPEIVTGYIPICSNRVYKVIKDICKEFVEFLPCTVENAKENYYVLNILVQKNNVDYEKSVYHRFPSTGKIMFFEYIAFTSVINEHLFKVSDLPFTYFFCDEYLKKELEKLDVKGMKLSAELFIK